MSNISNDKIELLANLFSEAATVASKVPEHLQQCAFVKAVEYLTNCEFGVSSVRPKQRTAKERNAKDTVKSAKKSGRLGPKAAISELAKTDFLSTLRTLPEIQQFLKTKKGHEYSANELAISAVRLVRDGVLEREQNDGGQYAYRRNQ